MKLGLFVAERGHHIAAWRDPATELERDVGFSYYANLAAIAERGCLDFLFNADIGGPSGPYSAERLRRTTGASRVEPLTLLAAMSSVTRHIGLIATMSTTYCEPFHIARFFAGLDQLSGGRVGWNVVTTYSEGEARNFGREIHLSHDERYERAKEFTEVVLGLWDCWEDGAILADRESGIFLDPAKLHPLDHRGDHFSVRGPLTVGRSAQGQPVLVQAGQSEVGRDFAARTAEVIFTVQQDLDEAKEFYADVQNRAASHGRPPNAIRIMPGLVPVVWATMAEAEEKYDKLQSLIHPDLGISLLSHILGFDLSGYPVDGPLPDMPPSNAQQGRQKLVADLARRENMTLRQLYMKVGGVRAHLTLCGTPDYIADVMEEWVATGAADGFNILPPTLPQGLEDFVDHVVPVLQRRGLFRTVYDGTTLRDHLELPVPVSKWATGH
ncbi:MAG: LLM class flavin-dependent oxidoreductase [Proteobacteria bacterium]|nr:LLM class flavin-dependent oxidoreductase [Pseudomonadota bacterium]